MRYEHLIALLHELLDGHDDDVRPFAVLSDEELAALEQPGPPEFTVRPWIEAQPDVDAALAARFGHRSLLLRGLVEPVGVADDGDALLGLSDQRSPTHGGWARASCAPRPPGTGHARPR